MKASVFKRIRIKTWEEFYREVSSKLRDQVSPCRKKDLTCLEKIFVRKLEAIRDIILDEYSATADALKEISGHPFTRELYRAQTGIDPGDDWAKLVARRRVVNEIYRGVKSRKPQQAAKAELVYWFRAGLGRLLSVYKRDKKVFARVKNFLVEVSKLPDVEGDMVVVLAGVPQVGKSTLLSKLTSSKPEIGSYPFTTKTLIAGHMDIWPYGRIVLIDSPGVLESPIEDKNLIEYKAILAVKYLADYMLFLIDPSPNFYFSLSEQLNVYKSLKKLLGDKSITIVINKVDTVDSSLLEEVSKKIREETGLEPLHISALTGLNLDRLRNILKEALMERKQLLSQ